MTELGHHTLHFLNIYMPYDDRSVRSSNYDEYMNYLGVVSSIHGRFNRHLLSHVKR